MYRIIIVDDEPLILAGISSMIRWEEHDCTIVGKATNGPTALELVRELQPDILITDIRMPVLDGLELVERCREAHCSFAFLVLTNLEEFALARKALELGASGYLVKLNLNEEELLEALERAKEDSDRLRPRHLAPGKSKDADVAGQFSDYLNQRFFLNLQTPQPSEEMKALCRGMVLLLFNVRHGGIDFPPEEEAKRIRQVTPQILEILNTLSLRFFSETCLLAGSGGLFLMAARPGSGDDDGRDAVSSFSHKANTALKTYFEMTAVFGVSQVCKSAEQLDACFEQARIALDYYYYDSAKPLVFYTGQKLPRVHSQSFNINFIKKDLSACVHQNDSGRLQEIFDELIALFEESRPGKSVAVSACINLYTYLYSFFEDESEIYGDIFPYSINVAQHLNRFTSLAEILEWMRGFCGRLCKLLEDRKKNPSDRLVTAARQYVDAHCQERLTLAKIAQDLNISAGHLSQTFSKSTGMTVSDYIAFAKTERAKELLATHQYLIYEISDMLAFESPYYFSKVFKKVTGLSPREFEKSV